jgi:hypothetical protein
MEGVAKKREIHGVELVESLVRKELLLYQLQSLLYLYRTTITRIVSFVGKCRLLVKQ